MSVCTTTIPQASAHEKTVRGTVLYLACKLFSFGGINVTIAITVQFCKLSAQCYFQLKHQRTCQSPRKVAAQPLTSLETGTLPSLPSTGPRMKCTHSSNDT